MHSFKSGNWNWRFSGEAPWRDLAPYPERIAEGCVVAKANPVRTVFRRGAYYIKVELPKPMLSLGFWSGLLHSKMEREFLAAGALRAAGVPAVEALGYGWGEGSSALVTRAVDSAMPAGDYYYKEFVKKGSGPEKFLEGWTDFTRRLLDSGFHHPDFHNGNILYVPETERFLLVDVYGVRRPAGGLRSSQLEAMRRIVFEMRRPLSPERLEALIAACGIPDARDYMEKGLRAEAKLLLKKWPKRKEQILSGYGKFVKKISFEGREIWMPLDLARETDANEADLDKGLFDMQRGNTEELVRLLLSAFYCQFAGLPHRRVFAYDPSARTVYLEKADLSKPPGEAELESYNRYARLYGVEAKASSLGRDSLGRLIMASFDFRLP